MNESQEDHRRLVNALRLSMVAGVGPRLRGALLERYGDEEQVLAAAAGDLRGVPGIGPKLAQKIAAAPSEQEARQEIARCQEHGIAILVSDDPTYPRMLREIYDPPAVLFVRGTLRPEDDVAVAMVGSRHATHYGTAQARQLAGSLARAGITVVSGLARGIDGAAHRGALEAGGRTLAVFGSGLLQIYPPEHAELAQEIAEHGALISEAPPDSRPHSGAFPQRNRIISGLTLGTVVVEASQRSGALISARHAMEQGREVFAVPGRVDNRMARGCHQLIRDGAKLVETADDILEELGPLCAPAEGRDGQVVHHPAELLLNEMEQRVLAAVDSEPVTIDHVVATCGLPVSQVLSTVSVLETRRLVHRVSGNLLVRP